MRLSLCNEVIRDLSFPEQCRYAAALGYDGIEVAPFTLSENPHLIPSAQRVEFRRAAEESGIQITGLHWLLLTPAGLSITSPDDGVRKKTAEVMKGLVELCRDLGGKVLIHGSPKQRMIEPGESAEAAMDRARGVFAEVTPLAQEAGVVYCIEPLTTKETNFINNLQDASRLVDAVGNPAFRSMLDTKAARGAEDLPVEQLIDRWLPSGLIAHVHVNDRNLRAPGQGDDPFYPVFKALYRHGYQGVVGVEPFDYHPDGRTSAARAIGYLQGLMEAVREQATNGE